jgi:adenylate cyclase
MVASNRVLALVVNPGLPEEQTFPLSVGAATIGRTKDNEIFCVHKSLSRKHARLEFDGHRIRLTDLQSKNGVYFKGRRVEHCDLVEGDSFRCGDITVLVEGATARTPKYVLSAAQTLPSTFAMDPNVAGARKATRVAATPQVLPTEDEQRDKDRLFALIKATELVVGDAALDKQLDELVVLAVQVLEVDRIALLTLDERSLEMKPRAVKTFVGAGARPYSRRVVEWIVDRGAPATLADVSREKALPGDIKEDANIRAAMCVPINPGGGTIGVLYVDSLSRADCFHADDLAVLRALANLAAVAIDSDALRRSTPTRA